MLHTMTFIPPAFSEQRYIGCLLGLALGDAIGARFEGMTADFIRQQAPDHAALAPGREVWYTDDTQMAIGVAEVLMHDGRIDVDRLYQQFVRNYEPQRGYGRGARHVLEAGDRYWEVASSIFPGGSYGNGAAMRVAPVGLFFAPDWARVWAEAERQALPTHVHPLGIEGAQLLALAVAWAVQAERFAREELFDLLEQHATHEVYRRKLAFARSLSDASDLDLLGNGIEAQESVVTAIASFVLSPDDHRAVVWRLIHLGGDTDTLAAMGGALTGAFAGAAALPADWLSSLERTPQGHDYLRELGAQLRAKAR